MRQAIETKYISPTDTEGAFIKVTCLAKTMRVPWDYNLGVEENHRQAAIHLMDDKGWTGKNLLYTGTLKNGNYVHVQVAK